MEGCDSEVGMGHCKREKKGGVAIEMNGDGIGGLGFDVGRGAGEALSAWRSSLTFSLVPQS